jgi:uncharacterized protein
MRSAMQGLAVLLVLSSAPHPTLAAETPAQLKDFPRQALTIQRKTGRDIFQVWIADTPARHQQGLMWVRKLAPDQGMLFLLETRRPFDLWMKNTYLSLDMVFFDEAGRVLGIARNTTPLSTAIVSSPGDVAGVLEILAGESQRRGIEVGDRLVHPAFGNR